MNQLLFKRWDKMTLKGRCYKSFGSNIVNLKKNRDLLPPPSTIRT